ncbi:MAG TPA: ABC transporter permease, partial [Cyclobacteriaceae bacterium]
MLFNYLLLSIRNIFKQQSYTFINAAGLSIGLASSIFILLYVRDELTFDTMHPYAENTYRMGYWLQQSNGETQSFPYAPSGWDNYIKDNYEGVTHITSYMHMGMPTSIYYEINDKILLTEDIVWAENNLNELLSMPIVRGNANNTLKELNSIMISQSAAKQLFGNEDPINKTVGISHVYSTHGQKVEMLVTAVYKDFPSNSHLEPKYVANILALKPFNENLETTLDTYMGDGPDGQWTQSIFVCTNEAIIPVILEDFTERANELIERYNLDIKFKPLIRKITDVHFDQEISWSITHRSADIQYIYLFISIAILILIVAAINYVNLATARSAARAREIGLRKTFGGVRLQIFTQFMIESFLLVLLSVFIALTIVIILLPHFNSLTQKTIGIIDIFKPDMLLILLGVIVFVTLLAGGYPSLFISGFKPASVLKGKFAFGKGSNRLRQTLITLQFIVAVALLVGTVIIIRQMTMMRDSKLNEAGDQIVSIRFGGFGEVANNLTYQTFKSQILRDSEIQRVTLANHLPRLDYFGPISMRMQFPEIKEEEMDWFQLNGDYDFPKTFDLKFIAGRDFDSQNVADSANIILNESAVKSLGLTAKEVVGKAVIRPAYSYYGGVDSTQVPVNGYVIGVVEDFPYRSMHNKIDPLGISPKPHFDDRIIHVKLPAKGVG